MEATRTIHDLAGEGYRAFETAERPDGEKYTRKLDDAPSWVDALVYAAHGSGDMLPDDYRYEYVREALGAIEEAGEDADLDDVGSDFAYDGVDVYTGQLTDWMASHSYRLAYCDEAIKEGFVDPGASMDRRMMAGQSMERREVFQTVREALEAEADA